MLYWIIMIVLIILLIGAVGMCVLLIKRQGNLKRQLQQSYDYKRVTRKIIAELMEHPKFVEEYLREKNYGKIAIYGNNEYTNLMIELLKSTEIKVAYVIASEWSASAKDVILKKKADEEVDATIIVTDSRKDQLVDLIRGDAVSFYDLLYNKL